MDDREFEDKLSATARELHVEWESPDLWPRIRRNIEREKRPLWLAAAAAILALTIPGAWLALRPMETPATASREFLTGQALRDLELAEAAHVRAITKLTALAGPKLNDVQAPPLIASYREKLLVLDSAIAELKLNAEQNRLNARLRMELASAYAEKRRTLQEIVSDAN